MRNRKERRKDESERSQSHAKPSLLLAEDGNPNHITESTARAHPSFNYVSISFPTLFQFFPTVCSSEIHFADWGEFVAELNRMIGGEMERLPGGPCSLPLSLPPLPMAKLAGIFFFNRPDEEREERGRESDRRRARGTAAAAADNFSGSHGSQTTSSNDKSREREGPERGRRVES